MSGRALGGGRGRVAARPDAGRPGCLSAPRHPRSGRLLSVERDGYRVTFRIAGDEGATESLAIRAHSRPRADVLVRKVRFWSGARPEWDAAQIIGRALWDLDAWCRLRGVTR